MPRVNKIRAAGKEDRVRELVASGKSHREIRDALQAEGLKVSQPAVSRFIREDTADRREAARSVAAADAQESVPLVTSSLRELITLGMERARKAEENRDFARLSQAITQASRALHQVTVGDDDDTPREALKNLADWVWGKG